MPDLKITLTDAEFATLGEIAGHGSALGGTTAAIVARSPVRRLIDEWRTAPATDNDMPLIELQNGRASKATIARRASEHGK